MGILSSGPRKVFWWFILGMSLLLPVWYTSTAHAVDPGGATPVNAQELHQYCDLRADEADDPDAQQGCVKQCVTSLGITASKSQAYHNGAQLAYLIALVLTIAVCAGAFVVVSKKGALADWTNGKMMGGRAAVAVASLILGLVAGKLLEGTLAFPHMQAMYQDLLTFKKEGKAEAQSSEGSLVCSDAKLKGALDAAVSGSSATATNPGLLAMASYTGVVRHFDKLQLEGSAKMDKRGIDDRWADVTKTMLSASTIKPDAGTTDEVIRSSKIYEEMTDNVGFPKSALVAALLGTVLGLLVGFGIRRATA